MYDCIITGPHRDPRNTRLQGNRCRLLHEDAWFEWLNRYLIEMDEDRVVHLDSEETSQIAARGGILRSLFLWLRTDYPLYFEEVMNSWYGEYLRGGTWGPPFAASWLNMELEYEYYDTHERSREVTAYLDSVRVVPEFRRYDPVSELVNDINL